uniref:Uncharacterized protein n=1 Tax=Zea mays TaxID=4577 RepID=C0P2U3_MAIZE|nr:unknown [Zea mays]
MIGAFCFLPHCNISQICAHQARGVFNRPQTMEVLLHLEQHLAVMPHLCTGESTPSLSQQLQLRWISSVSQCCLREDHLGLGRSEVPECSVELYVSEELDSICP